MKAAWGLVAVACLGLGILLGRDMRSRSVSADKPAGGAEPLFTPVTASLAQQKMCDEQAGKKFHEDKHSTYDSYTSHYDPTVNVCYTRVTTYAGAAVSDVVLDAFGGRIYAEYVWAKSPKKKISDTPTAMCEVYIPGKPKQTCKSVAEFDALTEKYFGVAQ